MYGRFDEDEAWDFVTNAHTGILTTLRRDGMPMAAPVWFAVLDRTICISTRPRTKKVARIRRDPRASFVVEAGLHATELQGVHLTGVVRFEEDPAECERIATALEDKYTGFRTAEEELPERFRRATTGRTFLRFVPDPRILSWDNTKL